MTKKIRVLQIIKTLGLGGAEANLLNLVEAFDTAKTEMHVAYSYGGEIEQRFRAAGVRLFKYAEQNHKVKSLHTIAIVLRLTRYIRRHQIDIVQTHNFNGHVWGLMAAKLAGAKLIEHVHDNRYTSRSELARRHGLQNQYRFIKYFRKHSDRVIVLTRDNVEFVVRNGFAAPGEVLHMLNGIPLKDEGAAAGSGLRERFGVPPGATVILTSARIDRAKNISLILDIASRVVQAAPSAIFLIAGSGEQLDEYRTRARDEGLDSHVRFIGFHQDMYALLAASDIFLLPSLLELHSIATLEAMKMRLPVVISRGVGCNDDFIQDGENGFLCDPFQEQPWIDALVPLVNSAPLRERIGQKGLETCRRRFDIRGAAARLEHVYSELAA